MIDQQVNTGHVGLIQKAVKLYKKDQPKEDGEVVATSEGANAVLNILHNGFAWAMRWIPSGFCWRAEGSFRETERIRTHRLRW